MSDGTAVEATVSAEAIVIKAADAVPVEPVEDPDPDPVEVVTEIIVSEEE